MKTIVPAEWLYQHLHDSQVIAVDCRFDLGDPSKGERDFKEGHIPGAVYFDLEKDLSGPAAKHGGRHPLPDIEQFSDKLGEAGIGNDTLVVAYDDQGSAMASRLWWLLRYMGHNRVKVLDGGFAAWKEAGFAVETDEAKHPPQRFVPAVKSELTADMEEVKSRLHGTGTVIIDSREPERYAGRTEPIDPVAGHIPGAVNHFWKNLLRDDNTWRQASVIERQFGQVDREKEIIVHCGSGVTACPNILALSESGYTNVKLYPGSWSDWCSYEDNPIAGEGSNNSRS
ncbi:sulfurtransferase [Bacillus marinisedimentorum]|uniref:sulfurtransferase n=1 Tax=Bacillus marinisedimentorum TaxID=1821260 RepID=UPI0007E1B4F8|nr:sulfurtransferase [Bacillus marinisedimentorum]